jgi:hypothetical protein
VVLFQKYFVTLGMLNATLTVQLAVAMLLWTGFHIPFLVINVNCICVLFIPIYLCILLSKSYINEVPVL